MQSHFITLALIESMSRKQLLALIRRFIGPTKHKPSCKLARIREALVYVLTSPLHSDSLVEDDYRMATSKGFYRSYNSTRVELVNALRRKGLRVNANMSRLSCVRLNMLLNKKDVSDDNIYFMLRDRCVMIKVYSDLCRVYDSTYGIENLCSDDFHVLKLKILSSRDYELLVPMVTKLFKMCRLDRKDAQYASHEAQFLISVLLHN